jgi:hypothetical protein
VGRQARLPVLRSTNARVAAATADLSDGEIEMIMQSRTDPYESLKNALGREPTARDGEIHVAARRAARRDDA